MKSRFLPSALLALFVIELIAVVVPKPAGRFHLDEFGSLPVLMHGRIQPFDSVGRNALLQIRGTTDVPLEESPSWKFWHHPKKLKSAQWLLEAMTKPEASDQRPIFLIHHPELLRTLRLDEQGVERSGLRYYTYNQIRPHLGEIDGLASRFAGVDEKLRTSYQRQALKLENALTLYQRLQISLQPTGTRDLLGLLAEFEQTAGTGVAAFNARKAGQDYDKEALARFMGPANGFMNVANSALPLMVPPGPAKDQWVNFGVGVFDSVRQHDTDGAVRRLALIASAYSREDDLVFNEAVADYQRWLGISFPQEARKAGAEFFFNSVQAFLHAMIIYLTAFLLATGALLALALAPRLSESLRKSSAWLIVLAFAVHTFGLVFRMVLEGRPPVTNLYSSAIFIGWGAVLLGIALERFFRVGLGCAVASLSGFVTLIIAHNLAVGGDTMQMLQAVLDTNFWLATHVTTVTLGYASTFVAGLLGIAYVTLGLFTPILSQNINSNEAAAPGDPARSSKRKKGRPPKTTVRPQTARGAEVGKILSKMIYGIICFATLFSFVGTVLGGIWADQSWGRFWGWDPKENGALIIVLWNSLILHARWGGFARERGLALMSIFGNVVTGFSWFGVNMLGIGLHSYGFMDAAFKWLMLFVVSQLMLVGLGLVPARYWRSFKIRSGSRSSMPVPALPPKPESSHAPAMARNGAGYPAQPAAEAK